MLVLALAVIATFLSHACGCSTAGCWDYAELQAKLPVEFQQLQAAKLQTCWNGRCRTAGFSHLTEAPRRQGRPLIFEGEQAGEGRPEVTAHLWGESDDSLSIAVRWNLAVGQPKPGDVYQVTVTTDAGETVLAMRETATSYTVSQPNGEWCGPTCTQVRFDRR